MARFFPPMLCERLINPERIADRGYIAEPKLDALPSLSRFQPGLSHSFASGFLDES